MKKITKDKEETTIKKFKCNNDYKELYEYDDKGNKIHYKNSNGFEVWWKYNDKGYLIHIKKSKSRYYKNGNR